MKKVLFVLAITLALGFAYFGTDKVYAYWGGAYQRDSEHFEEMLQRKAEFLGVTVEELKQAHEDRTVHELVDASGVTRQQMWEHMKEMMLEHWKELGLSDEEIQQRLEWKEQRMQRMHDVGFRGKGKSWQE